MKIPEKDIDPRLNREVEHGRKIVRNAGRVWNWESPAGKLRWARRVKMLSSHITPEMKVLEIGCGTGYYTKELEKTGANIIAIDISPDLLEVARSSITSKNITFKIENAYATTFEDNFFDTVAGSSVLHHLEIEKAIREIFRILKPGGRIRFTEPNMLNPQIAIEKNISYIKEKSGDSPDETAFFKWSIKKLLKVAGFENISVTPFDFLHPATPEPLIPLFKPLCLVVERVPILREFAGSLYIGATKPV